MTYHVKCPYSDNIFSYPDRDSIRRFVYAMMTKKDCTKKVWIRNGKRYVGSMWKTGRNVWWQSKGSRTKRIVSKDGTLRM